MSNVDEIWASVCETVDGTGRLQALDLVEVNPQLGSPAQAAATVEAANRIVWAALGHRE